MADKIRKAIEILSGLAENDDDQPGPSSGSRRSGVEMRPVKVVPSPGDKGS